MHRGTVHRANPWGAAVLIVLMSRMNSNIPFLVAAPDAR